MSAVAIFACSASHQLGEAIALHYGQNLGRLKIHRFQDGEIQPRFEESIRGKTVFIIQSTYPPADHLMELLLTIDAAKRASASYITAVIPYFGFARQDRKDRPRVSIGAKLVADLLTVAGADRIVTMDLHAGQIQGFFNIPLDHLDSSYIFIPQIQLLNLSNLAFSGPDAGATARARMYANYFHADLIICVKYRRRPNEVAEIQVLGEVKDRNVIIVDDIVDTGKTLVQCAQVLLDKGAASVRAICTHPILSGTAIENIESSPLTELWVTDSIPLRHQSEKIKVFSCAKLFATAIKNVHEHRSIDNLFVFNKIVESA